MNVSVVPPTTVPVLEIVAIAGPLLVTVTVTAVGGATGRLDVGIVFQVDAGGRIPDRDRRRCHGRRDLLVLRRRAEAGRRRSERQVGGPGGDRLEGGRVLGVAGMEDDRAGCDVSDRTWWNW